MNQSDIRMGWPSALNCIPLETRKAHVTPPRERDEYKAGVAWFNDWREMRKINGAADRKVRLEADPPREADLLRPAAPPSTTDKPQGVFKAGDRVRVRPGYIKGDPYAPGTIVRIADFVYVQHDAPPKGKTENGLAGWCAENLVLDETPQADAGWIKHSDGRIPVGPDVMVEARLRDGYTERLPARCWDWRIFGDGNPHDITAYRIVKDQA